MRVKLTGLSCVVTREPGDARFSGMANGAGESRLLHHVKLALKAQGYDMIKKRMHKDGHLVDDMQQYLRERKPRNGRQLAIYNEHWAIMGAEEVLNRDGVVALACDNIAATIAVSEF